jgi:hypothetical protein
MDSDDRSLGGSVEGIESVRSTEFHMLLREPQDDSEGKGGAAARRDAARVRSLPYQRIKSDACAAIQKSKRGPSPASSAADAAVPDLFDDPVARLTEVFYEMDRPEGRRRLAEYFARGPYPRFEPIEGDPTAFVKVDEDGTRTAGRFVDGDFQAGE